MPDGQLALQIFVAVILPALVGLVTTRLTPGWGKSSLLVVLTLVASVSTELAKALQAHVPFNVAQVVMIAAGSYVLSMAVHSGIMTPFGLKDMLAGIGVRADPRLEALAVVNAEVQTTQGPVGKGQLAAELDYAEGVPSVRDQGYDAVTPAQSETEDQTAMVPHPLDPTADLVTPAEAQALAGGKHRAEG